MRGIIIFLGIAVLCLGFPGGLIGQTTGPAKQLSKTDKNIFKDFENRAKKYIKLREKASRGVLKISKDSSGEEITAHKTALLKAVQNARVNAKHGDIFTPQGAILIKSIIKTEFKGYERAELRETVLDADTKGVPLKVNAVYPESKELVEMSPVLLLALPQLPKQLRYRFVGRSLVILDRDTGLIIDFMREALP